MRRLIEDYELTSSVHLRSVYQLLKKNVSDIDVMMTCTAAGMFSCVLLIVFYFLIVAFNTKNLAVIFYSRLSSILIISLQFLFNSIFSLSYFYAAIFY